MKWNFTELLNRGKDIEFDEMIEIDDSVFDSSALITSVNDLHVSGKGIVDGEHDCVYVHMNIDCVMVCPDAITSDPIEVPVSADTDETYVMYADEEDDSARLVTDDLLDLMPAVIDVLLMEAPLQATVAEEGEYPEGDGWKVYTEKEYQESQKDTLDPRLAILKQFNNEQ